MRNQYNRKNMRRLSILVTAQTLYNLQKLADMTGSPKPRVVHKTFLDTWLRWLRAGSKRNEDGTPKLPKRKRAVEHEKQARTA